MGETGRYGAPGRREIGHGALGERALAQVLPSVEEFPYAIRLASKQKSWSQMVLPHKASICAGTLALMAGGVPIKAPVAGIAMGLISDGTNYTVLTDIQGLEDHFGNLDFKVAGTRPRNYSSSRWILRFRVLHRPFSKEGFGSEQR